MSVLASLSLCRLAIAWRTRLLHEQVTSAWFKGKDCALPVVTSAHLLVRAAFYKYGEWLRLMGSCALNMVNSALLYIHAWEPLRGGRRKGSVHANGGKLFVSHKSWHSFLWSVCLYLDNPRVATWWVTLCSLCILWKPLCFYICCESIWRCMGNGLRFYIFGNVPAFRGYSFALCASLSELCVFIVAWHCMPVR